MRRLGLPLLALATALAGGPAAAETDPYTLGMEAFGAERYDAAVTHFEAALERREGFAPYNYMLGMSNLRAGRTDAAIQAFQAVADATEVKPDLLEKAYVNMLRTMVDAGRYEAVAKRGEAARKRLPNSPEVLNQLGRAHLNQGDYAAAVDLLTQATGMDSSSWTIYNNLGLAYLNMGNFKGAMHAFRRSSELNQRLPFIYNNLGVAYERLKEYELAAQAFQQALDLDPNYKKARQSLKRVRRSRAKADSGKAYILDNEAAEPGTASEAQ